MTMPAFIGLGLFRLKKCMVRTYTDWHFSILKHRSTLYVVALVFILSNLVILVMTAIPYGKGGVPPWGWPIVTAVVISAATIYWGVLRLLMVPCGSTTLGSSIGFEPRFHDMREQSESSGLRYLIWEAENEGSPRFVTYKVCQLTMYPPRCLTASTDYGSYQEIERRICCSGRLHIQAAGRRFRCLERSQSGTLGNVWHASSRGP